MFAGIYERCVNLRGFRRIKDKSTVLDGQPKSLT
jgi:hypothetical protein